MYGLSVPSDVLSVQGLIRDTLAASASVDDEEASFAELKETQAVEKADLEKSLAASEERLADAERRIQELQHNRNTVSDFSTKKDNAEAKLKSSEEQVHFLEERASEQNNQLIEKGAVSTGYPEHAVILENDLANLWAEATRLATQHTVDKVWLQGIRTAFALHRTASQQHAVADSKDCEKMLASKAAVNADFRKFREDMQAKVEKMQASLDREKAYARSFDCERVRLLISRKSLKRQLQLRSEDSREVEDLKYPLDGAVAEERRSEVIIKSLWEQLMSARSDVDKYRQRLPLSRERLMADVTDGFSDFLYSLGTEIKNLVETQRKDTETTVKTNLEGLDTFLRSTDTKLSRPGPSS